jgi:hypothetical protein
MAFLSINDPIWANGQPDNNDVAVLGEFDCAGVAKSFYLADWTCDSTQGLTWFMCEVKSIASYHVVLF